jgi:hypothetical protein
MALILTLIEFEIKRANYFRINFYFAIFSDEKKEHNVLNIKKRSTYTKGIKFVQQNKTILN